MHSRRGLPRHSGFIGVKMSIYQENGFPSRAEYLADLARSKYLAELADDFGVDLSIVRAMADLLGANEDFDGLVTSLEDYSMGY